MAKSDFHEPTGARTETDTVEFAREFIEACFDGELAVIDDVMEPDVDDATVQQGDQIRYDRFTGRDSDRLKRYFGSMQTAFPDLSVTVQDTAADGDRVTLWWTAQGTHEHRIGRFEPTERPVKLQGGTVCTIDKGAINAVQMRWNLWLF